MPARNFHNPGGLPYSRLKIYTPSIPQDDFLRARLIASSSDRERLSGT
jgi:hypothetical protein